MKTQALTAGLGRRRHQAPRTRQFWFRPNNCSCSAGARATCETLDNVDARPKPVADQRWRRGVILLVQLGSTQLLRLPLLLPLQLLLLLQALWLLLLRRLAPRRIDDLCWLVGRLTSPTVDSLAG